MVRELVGVIRINAKDKAREENGQIIRPRETRSAKVYLDV
jgi:hypothetical protein